MTDGKNDKLDWAIPVMRTGYAGRALVYLVVAGISLWSVLRGGNGQGTSSAFAQLESAPLGKVVLVLIFLGMLAYAVWRLIDAIWDLECYGSDGEGIIARLGMIVTGVIHLILGFGALLLVFTASSGGGESGIAKAAGMVMGLPGGRFILGAAGIVTIGAGLYYGKKAYERAYRKHLRGNEVTRNWDGLLRAGVASQGFVVGMIGVLIAYAAWTYNPSEAGGLGGVFGWLSGQPYGQILIGVLTLGLLCFALFCAVNAVYRIVPRASDPDIQTLAARFSS
ncbi:hypothetical protein PARPLA_01964 [Rhodobacteraceae bacterium THAF1]|uniref:DUF1206 domain-containing protein n=1 Tax=Palleronia sp. THAF1 TaxID=2587842 RepID=UPI000F3BC0AD|nr:DUF1206 domain-containing protein [Palleronia sp. THAF1]QFU08901.1 hypothetical protein FIU81_09475 [Palleronia sp. THAF1]VDC24387.1 hypothetical protein PARPLA_01964 [Rhodobacteraceae bacterium THAF1]